MHQQFKVHFSLQDQGPAACAKNSTRRANGATESSNLLTELENGQPVPFLPIHSKKFRLVSIKSDLAKSAMIKCTNSLLQFGNAMRKHRIPLRMKIKPLSEQENPKNNSKKPLKLWPKDVTFGKDYKEFIKHFNAKRQKPKKSDSINEESILKRARSNENHIH